MLTLLLGTVIASPKKAKPFSITPLSNSKVSSKFNKSRIHPIYKTRRPHNGTDFVAPKGTPVHVTGPGKVIKSGYSRLNGNYVFVQHDHDVVTKYLHLTKCKVEKGEHVHQSEVIGTVGSTGLATGPHLHYEVLVAGVPHDPQIILNEGLPQT